MGLYEAAFDIVMRKHGANPKVVASTATIRRAEQQVSGVFGRQVAVFPPSGLDADDSYFVRFDRTAPGRLTRRHATGTHAADRHGPSLGSLAASASAGRGRVAPGSPRSHWTLVGLPQQSRELGKTVTRHMTLDRPARMSAIPTAKTPFGGYAMDEFLELTSNVLPAEIPGKL